MAFYRLGEGLNLRTTIKSIEWVFTFKYGLILSIKWKCSKFIPKYNLKSPIISTIQMLLCSWLDYPTMKASDRLAAFNWFSFHAWNSRKKRFSISKNRYYEGVCNDLCVRDTCMSSWLSYDLVRSFSCTYSRWLNLDVVIFLTIFKTLMLIKWILRFYIDIY